MGSSATNDYCAFTKAVEHLGDRWSLLIVRELVIYGPQGFSTLASGLPGHVSRSVLADKLRKLEELGLVAHDPVDEGRKAAYRLTPAGDQLEPVLRSLWGWAEKWVPEDPAMAARDPDIINWWLTNRVDRSALPEREVVLDIDLRGTRAMHCWLVLHPNADPTLCIEDPLLDENRYLYVEAEADGLYPVARGLRGWDDAIADRSIAIFGDPALIAALPSWFASPTNPMRDVRAAVA